MEDPSLDLNIQHLLTQLVVVACGTYIYFLCLLTRARSRFERVMTHIVIAVITLTFSQLGNVTALTACTVCQHTWQVLRKAIDYIGETAKSIQAYTSSCFCVYYSSSEADIIATEQIFVFPMNILF